MKEHTTSILPPPKEELDPETALKWLHEDFMGIFLAIQYGFEAEDAETRGAFGMLATDVTVLFQAAIEAVAEQQSVRIRVSGHPVDLPCWTLWLTRVVAYRCEIDDGNGYYEDGFAWFAEVLRERLVPLEAVA